MSVSNERYRVSQRVVLACEECRRRRIRCDKKVPCKSCIRYGLANSCTVKPTRLTTQSTKSKNEIKFLRELLPRVLQLQESEMEKEPISNLIQRRLELLETGTVNVDRSSPSTQDADTMATALPISSPECAGNQLKISSNGSARGRDQQHDLSSVDALPNQQMGRQLVNHHMHELCWNHNAVHTTEFLNQCERFWNTGEAEHPLWMSLYFAILSGAAWTLPPDVCQSLYRKDNLRSEAKVWYEKMVQVLYDLDFLENHSIFSIQAVITTTLVAYPLGNSNRQTILLNTCLRIAQSMGLHEYSKDADSTRITTSWKGIVKEQTIRRVWWELVIQDYFLASITGSYSISPNHFSTPLPLNCDDHDLIERSVEHPTVTSYCNALAKISLLMPPLVDGTRNSTSPIPVEFQYAQIQRTDAQMRELAKNLPPYLKAGVPHNPSWPAWVIWARTSLTVSAADKIIMIHRSFLVRSFQDPAYVFTRRTCASAAATILHEFNRVKLTDIVNLWTISTFTVGAAIVLYLDVIHDDGDRQKDLGLVLETVSGLKLLSHDHVACRGVLALEALIKHKERRPAARALLKYDKELPDLAKFVPTLKEYEDTPDEATSTDLDIGVASGEGQEFDYGLLFAEEIQQPLDILEQWLNQEYGSFLGP